MTFNYSTILLLDGRDRLQYCSLSLFVHRSFIHRFNELHQNFVKFPALLALHKFVAAFR